MEKKSRERIAIVALNYKAVDDTLLSVESLLKQTYNDLHIIVVENGSEDGSAERLEKFQKAHSKNLTILYNTTNKGFAGGVNTGIRWAQEQHFSYVALFNNDAVADKDWLLSLASQAASHETYGIVTGLLLHEDGKTIDTTGEQYSTWGLAFARDRNQPAGTASKAGEVFGATGGASLYKMSMLNAIGLFDEAYFAYYEDVDISFRAQLAGWKVYYEPSAIAYHKRGATSSKMPGFAVYQTFKNLPLVFTKNVPRELLLSIGVRFWFTYLLMLGNAIAGGNSIPSLKGYFRGISLFWTVALPARGPIQRAKKVKSSYIKSILWSDLPPEQKGMRKLRRIFTGK
jgi:GT2 family glycosyltransferase